MAGARVLRSPSGNSSPNMIRVFNISEIIIHPDHDKKDLYNDIAIIKLNHQLPFKTNPYVQPICMSKATFDYTGLAMVAGWGETEESKNPNRLRMVQVPVLRSQMCEEISLKFDVTYDRKSSICAGRLYGGQDACHVCIPANSFKD